MTVTIGAGLAYLGVAAIVADLIMLKFLGDTSNKINEAKNENIIDEDGAAELDKHVNKGIGCCRKAVVKIEATAGSTASANSAADIQEDGTTGHELAIVNTKDDSA